MGGRAVNEASQWAHNVCTAYAQLVRCSLGMNREKSKSWKIGLSGPETFGYNLASAQGGIAQLGERLHGMQEVSGSIPLTSTS